MTKDNQELLATSDAAIVAGVSAETLDYYANSGLLTTEGTAEERRFMRSELTSLFGEQSPSQSKEGEPELDAALGGSSSTGVTLTSSEVSSGETQLTPTESSLLESPTSDANRDDPFKIDLKSLSNRPSPETSDDSPLPEAPSSDDLTGTPPAKQSPVEHSTDIIQARINDPASIQSVSSSLVVRESDHDSNESLTLREVNRELRQQIELLREERNWLRTRVERLEGQIEREQMLLLSESQTVKSLLGTPKPRGLWSRGFFWGSK